jgi:hypothetical protein
MLLQVMAKKLSLLSAVQRMTLMAQRCVRRAAIISVAPGVTTDKDRPGR